MRKHPNSNVRAPENLQVPGPASRYWIFEVSLAVGAWNLDVSNGFRGLAAP